MFRQKDLKLLNISVAENAILSFLAKKKDSALVTDVATVTKIPRTTVHFLLKKLKERQLVSTIRVDNHREWYLSPPAEIASNYREAIASLERKTNIAGGIVGKNIGVEVYEGVKNIKDAYKKILQIGRGNRVYFIQGNKSVQVAMKKVDWQFIIGFHTRFKERGIIMEAVMGKNTLELFKTFNLQQLKSHHGRAMITHVVADRLINFDTDIVMFENVVMLINLNESNAVIIKNKAIVQALHSLFLAMQEVSTKIDINQHIRQLIEQKEDADNKST